MLRLSDRVSGAIIGALALALVLVLARGAGAGPLDPGGPPSSTLPQVEPRNPIPPVGWDGTFPITINQPGSYFLTRNLTATGATNGIEVDAENVAIDLNGFTLDGAAIGALGVVAAENFTLTNGTVRRWLLGITASAGGRYHDLHITENGSGVELFTGAILEHCVVRENATGVTLLPAAIAGTIANCEFSGNTTAAINDASDSKTSIIANTILVPNNATGLIAGDASTVRQNVIVGETATYTSIDLGSSVGSVIVQNRFECGKGVGNAADDIFVFDFASDQTNICNP
jgi:hypothetical protein